MHVTVLLTDKAATAMISARDLAVVSESAAVIVRALSRLGFHLEPMHPGIKDPVLHTHFFVDVPDQNAADAVVASLRSLPQVKGAYVKPSDELP